MSPFELLLFTTDPLFARLAIASGVAGILVDWENRGKEKRQQGYDTQVNHDTLADLERIRQAVDATVICRINNIPGIIETEIEQAIAAGVNEILIPMVRTPEEVQRVFTQVNGRCQVGILIETVTALNHLPELSALPLKRVYVGLNDLSIERNTRSLFTAISDGTVEMIRANCQAPFGFGGLTLPEMGSPIPCRLLMGEMLRLQAQFSFLRRSFHRDMQGRALNIEIPRILHTLETMQTRPPQEIAQDQEALHHAIAKIMQPKLGEIIK